MERWRRRSVYSMRMRRTLVAKFVLPRRALIMKGITLVRKMSACSLCVGKMAAWFVRTDSINSRPKVLGRLETRRYSGRWPSVRRQMSLNT
jgi:hypothetical protein